MRNAHHVAATRRSLYTSGWFLACALSLLSVVSQAVAQSSDPETLRRIINQKNAEAAQATWGYWTGSREPGAGGGSSNAGGPSNGSPSGSGSASSAGSAGGFGATQPTTPLSATSASSASPAAGAVRSTPSTAAVTTATAADHTPSQPQPLMTGALQGDFNDAQLTYAEGKMTLHAENASLNAVLHQIATRLGMTIDGPVFDDQVYGTYGPAAPADLLLQLLRGTGANVVIKENRRGLPTRLTLSVPSPQPPH